MQPTAIYETLQLSAALARIGDLLPSAFRAFAQSAGPMVLTALWQGAVVAIGLSICLRLAPRISASHRFALWTASFVALLCLPLVPLLSHFTAGAAPSFSSSSSLATPEPWLHFDVRWSLAI